MNKEIDKVQESEECLEAIANAVKDPLLMLDKDLRVKIANLSFYRFFKSNASETIGRLIFDLGNGQWNIPKLTDLLRGILPKKGQFNGFEVTHKFQRIGEKTMLLNAKEIPTETGKNKIILLAIEDITERTATLGMLSAFETRYRKLFESAIDGSIILDANTGTIIDANELIIEMLGFSHKQLLAKKIWEIGLLKDIVANKAQFKKLKAGGNVKYENLPLQNANGKKVDVEFFSKTFIVDNQKIIQCLVRDVTEKKRIEEKIHELSDRDEAVLSSIGDAVFACDKDGKILLFNKMAEEMTGISAKEAVGKHYNQAVTFIKEIDGKPSSNFVVEAIKDDKITKMTNHVLLIRKDGRQIPVADSAAPIKTSKGQIVGCVVVFHDVTKERQIDKSKTEFVSLASHQLRTPLSTINWYSEMLLSEDVGTLTPKQKQYTEEVYHASKRMVNLINALLNVSRLELGTFAIEPETVNIISLAKNCVKELGQQILKKKLTVEQNYDKKISGIKADPKLLTMIIQNFLSNSVKYTDPGGKIGLSISKEKGNLLIVVSDTGIGIPKNQQELIFEKLFRADNAKKMDPDGSGLGLYIIKEIISYTGGKIWFESSEEKGTIFYVTLPASGMIKKVGGKELV